LAPIWWNRNGAFKALHDINGLRVGYIDGRAPLSGKKVLDVGCGGGILSEAMAALGAEVTGIDAGEAPLAVAKLHLKESRLHVDYRRATAEYFAEVASGHFDVVACMELLEHVPDPGSIVAACTRLVIPGGDVFFATLNRNPKSFLFAIIGAEYILRLVRRGTHAYRRFIKPSELESMVKRLRPWVSRPHGFALQPVHPELHSRRQHPRELPDAFPEGLTRPVQIKYHFCTHLGSDRDNSGAMGRVT